VYYPRITQQKNDNMHTEAASAFRGHRGSTLVAVMWVMAAVSIFGVMSLNISSVELEISSNERQMREVFYLSEGAAFEAIQRLINAPRADLEDKINFWHHSEVAVNQDGTDFRDPLQWKIDGRNGDNAMQSALNPQSYYSAVEHRLAAGSSAVVTGPRLYMNRVYGLCSKHKALNLVEIGYQLRY
jgi:Tfp pilus assembly protein PilX